MATTDAEMLELVNTAITARLNGDAYEEYSEAAERFRGTSLADLFKIRDRLSVSTQQGFSLARMRRGR